MIKRISAQQHTIIFLATLLVAAFTKALQPIIVSRVPIAAKTIMMMSIEEGIDERKWSTGNQEDSEKAKDQLNIWPLDEFNVKLLNEVHPKSWSPKINTDKDNEEEDSDLYDFIAIGAGAAGLVSSRQARRRGAKSAMISSNLAGGDCLNVGEYVKIFDIKFYLNSL